ncbi:hypothetical protein [Streptomyces sp. NPDC002185]|uniref:hypothetical protein n=1 Tax=Streptomyces sp. NPDC002185 TaxID=3364636 RepID=UPI0036897963
MIDDKNESVPHQASVRVVLVTPELAAELVARESHNRRVDQGHVAILAAAIQRGHWQLTHQGIALDASLSDGAVVDGQHRLYAVVKADIAVPMVVFEHVPRETFSVLDTGRRRSSADALALGGESDPTLLASTVRHVHLYRTFSEPSWAGGRGRLTNDQVLEKFAEDPARYRLAVQAGRIIAKHAFMIPTAAAVGYFITVEPSTPQTRVNEWVAGLTSGANLGLGDARLALRRALAGQRTRRSELRRRSTRGEVGLYLKAWNYWILGREVRTLRFGKKEKLPAPAPLLPGQRTGGE